MFEYNKEVIERILKIEGFNIDNINMVKHVPMHQYRIINKDKPLLLIENLQVCIGLYAYSKEFGYAAHLNPVVIRGDEFVVDKFKNIKHCNRVEELYKEIIKANPKNEVYIGISIGCNPTYKTYIVVDMLNILIDKLIVKLKKIGINAIKLDLENNHIFIVDSINEKIIIPQEKQLLKKR